MLLELVKQAEEAIVGDLKPEIAKVVGDWDTQRLRDFLHNMRIEAMKDIEEAENQAGVRVKTEPYATGWENGDSRSTAEIFRDLQARIEEETGKSRRISTIRWPPMLLNVAIMIYNHSRSTYALIKELGIMTLPSQRLMRKYRGAGETTEGVDLRRLLNQRKQMRDYAKLTKHPLADTHDIDIGYAIEDEMKIRVNARISKTTGEWYIDILCILSALCFLPLRPFQL